MATVYIRLGPFASETGMLIYLYDITSPFALVNTGGDTLTVVASTNGMFQATVAEALSGKYDATVTLSGGTIVAEGRLDTSVSFLVDDPAGGGTINNVTNVTGGPLVYTGPVSEGGEITLKQGDAYTVAASNSISLNVTDVDGVLFAKLDGNEADLAFGAGSGFDRDDIVGTIASVSYESDVTTIEIEITATESAKGNPGQSYEYDIQQSTSGNVTHVTGCLTVQADRKA